MECGRGGVAGIAASHFRLRRSLVVNGLVLLLRRGEQAALTRGCGAVQHQATRLDLPWAGKSLRLSADPIGTRSKMYMYTIVALI